MSQSVFALPAEDAFLPAVPACPIHLDIGRLPNNAGDEPRLILIGSLRVVRLDRQECKLPPRPFQLLCFLAQRLKAGAPVVSIHDIYNELFSQGTEDAAVRDLIRQLREQLRSQLGTSDLAATLIQTRPRAGYLLQLPAAAVRIDS